MNFSVHQEKLAIRIFIKGRSSRREFPLFYSQGGSEFEYKRVGYGKIHGDVDAFAQGIKQTWAIY